ncbi:hypothetical protein [Paraburkholderia caribensis]|uniref:hypothetical protein n=1 Tax=Paraburkholderia caribensis TaxID=75105 RepID=UPI000A464A85|nr:hypothetical protein [Paraburkholderia caribensis]
MPEFKPDERQQKLIEKALRTHRKAQARRRYAPDRLVEKWSNEAGIEPPKPDGGSDASAEGIDGPRSKGD